MTPREQFRAARRMARRCRSTEYLFDSNNTVIGRVSPNGDAYPLGRNAPRIILAERDSVVSRKRFEYKRMTADEFQADLRELDMRVKTFARMTGTNHDRAANWYHNQDDIPPWVPVFLAVLRRVPGATAEARQEAAERIVRDLGHPERGEYPYLKQEAPDDDDA